MIPFNVPKLAGNELQYVQDAVERGQLSGDGHYTTLCQQWLESRGIARKCLLTHSCTAALEMCAILCGLEPGDEVILPSYTFVSTANAVCLRGAIPVFVDVSPDTLNIDPDRVAAAVTERTRAIFAVHYAGVVCPMADLRAIADEHGLLLVEDAAQALGSTYRGEPAGSLGDLSAFSFHETKNIISGEGGFIGINKPGLFERAEIIREKGTNRRKFIRGAVDKYTWVDIGSSYLPGELISSFLLAQLENTDVINEKRKRAWVEYNDAFEPCARKWGVRLPTIPDDCVHNGHLYYLILPDQDMQRRFIDHMKSRHITTPFHYVPLHTAPAATQYARVSGSLRVTEDVPYRLVRLPLWAGASDVVPDVLEAAFSFFEERS